MIFAFLALGLVSFTIIGQTVGQDQECPAIFQRYCAQPSYCLTPNPNCEILAYYPTLDQINQIVDLHNQFRQKVALGHTKLPPAANMLQMEWDYELAAVAQSYANQCKYEHDKMNCRRVPNFSVGQNLAIQTETGGHMVPQPDWESAINQWFAEIRYFPTSAVSPFEPPAQKSQDYRHFSQLIWANSFRVGCGYVLYKEGQIFHNETYTSLYACNYGSAGNVYGASIYKEGHHCSKCPKNTCCGYHDCNNYRGLCMRNTSDPPIYPPPMPNLFYCGFHGEADCDNYIDGNPNWTIEPTLGGNYLGIDLDGGQNSTITFKKKIQPNKDKWCLTLRYRKGPNMFNDPMSNTAEEVLYIPDRNYTVSQPLPGYDNPERQQFSTYNLTLSWDLATEFRISFSVPDGTPKQFLNVYSILAVDGSCHNK